MVVVIRMKRTGRRNAPCYRISVADGSFPRDGRTLENLGVYDPISPVPELRLKLDVERARHWVQQGAQPSETVRSIFEREGVYEGLDRTKKKRDRSGRKKKTARKARRAERKTALEARKSGRRDERLAARKAARQAAAAEAAEGGEG